MRNLPPVSLTLGDNIYQSPQDGTVAYASGTTLTLAGWPFVPVSAQFLLVEQTTAAGAVIRYPANSFYTTYSAPTLSVVGASFQTTDVSYRVYIAGPTRGYNAVSNYWRAGEVSPLDSHVDLINIVDTVNLAAAANEYPSANGLDMAGRPWFSLSGQLIEGDAPHTITVQVFGSNDEDPVGANRNWLQLVGRRVETNTWVNSIVCPTTTITFSWEFQNHFKYIKIVVTPTQAASNTVIVKMMAAAL